LHVKERNGQTKQDAGKLQGHAMQCR
jgi:hypothetical protein